MKRLFERTLLLLVALCVLASSGCVSQKLRTAATTTVVVLAEKSKSRDAAFVAALTESTRQQMEANRLRMVAQFEKKKLELRLQVMEAYDAEQTRTFQMATDRLNDLLNPTTSRLFTQLEKERSRAQLTGSRETEFELASQLSATMVEGIRREAELHDAIRTQITQHRATALNDLSKVELPAALSTPASDSTISSIVNEVLKNSNDYQKAVDETRTALTDYLDKTSPNAVAKDFFQGLVGDQITQLLSTKIASVSDKAEGELDKWLDRLTASAEKSIVAVTESPKRK